MSDPDLKREIDSIINHLDDASVSLINSGFGFRKSSNKLHYRNSVSIDRQLTNAPLTRPAQKPKPIVIPKVRESLSRPSPAPMQNNLAKPQKAAKKSKSQAKATRLQNQRPRGQLRFVRSAFAHVLDIVLISTFLFGSLFMVFKALNTESGLIETFENLTRFLNDQLDPLAGIAVVYVFSLFYYLFFFGFKATPIGAYLLQVKAVKK